MSRVAKELGSLCAQVYSGGTPTSSNAAYYSGEIPWLRTQEVTFNRIKNTEIMITEAGLNSSAAKWIPENSVIVAMYGNSAGRVAINEIPLTTNQACCNLVIDPKVADYRYVFYALKQSYEALKGQSRGAAQNNLNASQVRAFKISCPSVSTQVAIANILSAYDDLIENNRRRIQLLEQAARLLYKEWFVHLLFPGHEHVKIKDGVPEGWERHALTDLAENVSYGYTASSSQEEVGPKFLRITDIVPPVLNWDEVPYCEATTEDIQRNRLEVGDVVVARTGATVGYAKLISYLECQAVYASYLVRFRFRTPAMSIISGVFMESDAYKDHVRNHAGGAAQPNANAKVLGSAALLMPPQILQDQFSDFVRQIISQRDTLIRQNARLSKARDLLLPRMMNGEVIIRV